MPNAHPRPPYLRSLDTDFFFIAKYDAMLHESYLTVLICQFPCAVPEKNHENRVCEHISKNCFHDLLQDGGWTLLSFFDKTEKRIMYTLYFF